MEENSKHNDLVKRVHEWHNLSDAGLRLRMGEMTAQEIRTVWALLNCLVAGIDKKDAGI